MGHSVWGVGTSASAVIAVRVEWVKIERQVTCEPFVMTAMGDDVWVLISIWWWE